MQRSHCWDGCRLPVLSLLQPPARCGEPLLCRAVPGQAFSWQNLDHVNFEFSSSTFKCISLGPDSRWYRGGVVLSSKQHPCLVARATGLSLFLI